MVVGFRFVSACGHDGTLAASRWSRRTFGSG
jgi:hypothetical protein